MSAGLPLLSGPPPHAPDAEACRKCNKEFNILFARQKQCNHCGYLYCSTCTDYSALMPREHGYDSRPVCAFCIELLTITASGRAALKASQMAKLKKYIAAYNIRTDRVVEKDDLVNAILAARSPNGGLRREYEDFYRRHSVPDGTSSGRPRGVFSRTTTNTSASHAHSPRITPLNNRPTFARPDLEPDPPHYAPPPGPPPRSTPRQSYPPHASSGSAPTNAGQRSSSGSHNPPQPQSPPQPRAAPSPPPSMNQLLEMTDEQVSSLSVSSLKGVLSANHVNTGIGVLEKSELVSKVHALISDERRDRARREAEEEYERQQEEEARRTAHADELRREEEEIERVLAESLREHNERQRRDSREERHEEQQGNPEAASPPPSSPSPEPVRSPPPPPKMTPAAQSMAHQLERTGLCVVCQDNEANLAIVDCGHLCLCQRCSNDIMANTRECPLCRTRIVTEQRLLRIYRT